MISSPSKFMKRTLREKYSYRFTWSEISVIQYPQDLIAIQELVFSVKPDVIVETGVAHGGSLVSYASLLTLFDYEEACQVRQALNPASPKRRVIGGDVEIRVHNREAIRAHPMSSRIELIEGSSTDLDVLGRVKALMPPKDRVMVSLDSNQTHAHVLAELEAYAPLFSVGSY